LSSLGPNLSVILVRDPDTNHLSYEQIRDATKIIKQEIVQAADRVRVGRKIVHVHSIRTDQLVSYGKREEDKSLIKVKGEGQFEEIDSGITIPVRPYVIMNRTLLTNEIIEGLAITVIEPLFANIGRAIATKEDSDFFETLLRGSTTEVKASTAGELAQVDVAKAIQKVKNSGKVVLVVNPYQWADLAKILHAHDHKKLAYQLGVSDFYRTSHLSSGTAAVFDAESAAIFERRPITVQLHDNPARDALEIITTESYMPAVLDRDAVVKIVNC